MNVSNVYINILKIYKFKFIYIFIGEIDQDCIV